MSRPKPPPHPFWKDLTAEKLDVKNRPDQVRHLSRLVSDEWDWTGEGPETLADLALRKAHLLCDWRHGEAEDFAQTALIEFIEGIKPEIENPIAYLVTIIDNVASRYFTTNRDVGGIPPDATPIDPGMSIEGAIDVPEIETAGADPVGDDLVRIIVEKVLNEIEAKYGARARELLRLKFWNSSWNQHDIAREMAMKHPAVRKAMQRLREKDAENFFRRELARLLHEFGIADIDPDNAQPDAGEGAGN